VSIPEDLKQELVAAENMDWMQIVLNHSYGPPCFHLEKTGRFCGRAKGWHDKTATELFHAFTALSSFIERIATLTAQLDTAKAEVKNIEDRESAFEEQLRTALGDSILSKIVDAEIGMVPEDILRGIEALMVENNRLRAALDKATGANAAFDLLKRIVDKLKVAMPILDSFVTLQAIRSGNMNIYDGPSLENEMKEADALIAARRDA